MRPETRHFAVRLLAVIVACLTTGCAGSSREALSAELLRTVQVEPRVYHELRPGDALDVRFRRTPELNALVVVRPDGTVSLPLAGNLEAAGKTPEELAEAIEWRCALEIRDPDVVVIVTGFEGRAVFVGGQVEDPGRFVLGSPTSLLEAMILAGGPRESAYLEGVLLLRILEGGQRTVFELDLQAALDGREAYQNVQLLPTDIVYIPRSPIADVNLWVDQYLRQNIPFNLAVRPDLGRQ